MAFIVEEDTGNIILVQGDSGKYPVENVPNDKHYKAYFGIYNSKRKQVGFEVNVDIPAYNAGEIVYDNDLYCWSYSVNSLYSLNKSPSVGDILYNSNNEATLNTVASINSIVTEGETYTRNTANNINEYETILYAWDNSGNIYTNTGIPATGATIYNSSGEDTGYTVSEYKKVYAWRGVIPSLLQPISLYTESETPEDNDYVYYPDGTLFSYVSYDHQVYPDDQLPVYIESLGRSVVFLRYIEDDKSYIVVEDTNYSRNISDDIEEISSVTAYAWINNSNLVYTVSENPQIGENVYNSELIAEDVVTDIGSILVGVNEYLRNVLNDIPKTEIPEVLPTTNIEFNIPASLTDFLKVSPNEDTAEYYFGIKLCDDNGGEDTLLLGDSQIGDLNTITVYPKKLEGTISNG